MGAVYNVYVKWDYDDEQALVDRMNQFIDENHGQGVVFSLDEYAEKGIGRDNLHDLIQYFITDRDFAQLGEGEFESAFNASYGWETVMTGMFEYVADLLYDGSSLEIYPDNDRDYLEVQNGEAVWLE